MSSHDEGSSQQRIWRHFQNAAPDSFAGARPRLDYLIKQIARRTSSSSPAVLNIGIGEGYLEEQANLRRWHIHSLDPDPGAVNRLVGRGIRAGVGLIENIPHDSGSFDFVVASEVLEHLSDDQRLTGLGEIARVLRQGGWFLGTVPYRETLADNETVCPRCGEVFHRWGHHRSFDLPAIRQALSPWFEVSTLGYTAFVPWRGRGIRGAAKSLVRLMLAKLGEPISSPTLYWIACKIRTPS